MKIKIPTWMLAGGLALLFAVGLYEMLAARMDEGDAFPPYSSFRADPLGSKALYTALRQLPGEPIAVERHFRVLDRLVESPDGRTHDLQQTLIVLLGEEPMIWSWNPPKARVEAIEHAARAGATVLIAFRATNTVPTTPRLDIPFAEKRAAPTPTPTPVGRRARQDPEPAPTPKPNENEDDKKSLKERYQEWIMVYDE